MNKRLILYILGWVMICEGAAMQLCTVTSIMFRENEGLFFLITGAVCAGLGVDPAHIRTIVPLPKNYPEMEKVIREELEYHGVSVIVCRRECIQTLRRHAATK